MSCSPCFKLRSRLRSYSNLLMFGECLTHPICIVNSTVVLDDTFLSSDVVWQQVYNSAHKFSFGSRYIAYSVCQQNFSSFTDQVAHPILLHWTQVACGGGGDLWWALTDTKHAAAGGQSWILLLSADRYQGCTIQLVNPSFLLQRHDSGVGHGGIVREITMLEAFFFEKMGEPSKFHM